LLSEFLAKKQKGGSRKRRKACSAAPSFWCSTPEWANHRVPVQVRVNFIFMFCIVFYVADSFSGFFGLIAYSTRHPTGRRPFGVSRRKCSVTLGNYAVGVEAGTMIKS
jgi:hypothetical protein